MLGLSIYVLLTLVLDRVYPFTGIFALIANSIDIVVCCFFLADFFYVLYTSEHKAEYLFLKFGWIDLVASLPLASVPILRAGRALRMVRIIRLMRGVRSSKYLFKFASQNRALSIFLRATSNLVVFVAISSIVVWAVEKNREGASITDLGKAFWWSLENMAAGSSVHNPVSGIGKACAVFLMVAGPALLGTFTAYMASVFVIPVDKKENDAIMVELQEIKQRLAEIEKK